jgi:hypothetical protein
MLSLMLDLRFKTSRLVSSFIGQEQVVSIVEEYDQQSFEMLAHPPPYGRIWTYGKYGN